MSTDMIETVTGNLLDADVEALVNTVNTVGVMGRGIALQFKRAFPENFAAYWREFKEGHLAPGRLFVFDRGPLLRPRYLVNFPTKRHWRQPSRLDDIKLGLAALAAEVRARKIESIAVPPLGCGSGGLEWSKVLPLISESLGSLPGVRVVVFEPAGTPAAETMPNATPRPRLTEGRAALLRLMDGYLSTGFGYRLSLLETQKLAYFLQAAGQLLRLEFKAAVYGPYADGLRHVLNRLEGHFITGHGEGSSKPTTPISLRPGAAEEAEAFLREDRGTASRIESVLRLIESFETPYGMELLSSVHWVATHGDDDRSVETAVDAIRRWNRRKAERMRPEHIRAAWQRLREQAWI
jgi:O-acetyl-ADP-ribose deacetylase (regulator of RNase III)